MADYKELIRRAVQALPENNGAARRAVYEKARAALVGQLRGLNPPLAARDITQHRLQLEDCIRQVEQEASEAVIAGLKQNEELALPPPPRQVTQQRQPTPAAAATLRQPPPSPRPTFSSARPAAPQLRPATAAPRAAAAARPAPSPVKPAAMPAALQRAAMPVRGTTRPQPASRPQAEMSEPESIEDIIAAENAAFEEEEPEIIEVPRFRSEPRNQTRYEAPAPRAEAPVPRAETDRGDRADRRPLPSIVARAEAAKSSNGASRPFDSSRRAAATESRRDGGQGAGQAPARLENGGRSQPLHRQTAEPMAMITRSSGNAAMSSIREVEVEPEPPHVDPQTAIERAIATLEREARGDEAGVNGKSIELPAPMPVPYTPPPAPRKRAMAEPSFREQPMLGQDPAFMRPQPEAERGGGSAVTIFLLVFLLLLVAAGGAGFWAWREGFIDLDAMFGKSQPATEANLKPGTIPLAPDVPTAGSGGRVPTATTPAAPGGNTEAKPAPDVKTDARLSAPDQPATTPTAAEPSAQSADAAKSEARLGGVSAGDATQPSADASKPPAAAVTGSQSLLLEASQDGTTGAVPFSGTVDWSKGTDELGQPTLVGKANIPARNLGVSVLIRRNSDPTLPASHLMEINFSVSDSFIGGAIQGLPGVLLKNEELVQGTPLVGASARVVGNSFLFALSASAADNSTNKDLLTSRKWMDLAIIYATGKRAIITLEKDDKAQALFSQVFAAWDKTAAAK